MRFSIFLDNRQAQQDLIGFLPLPRKHLPKSNIWIVPWCFLQILNNHFNMLNTCLNKNATKTPFKKHDKTSSNFPQLPPTATAPCSTWCTAPASPAAASPSRAAGQLPHRRGRCRGPPRGHRSGRPSCQLWRPPKKAKTWDKMGKMEKHGKTMQNSRADHSDSVDLGMVTRCNKQLTGKCDDYRQGDLGKFQELRWIWTL